MDDGHDARWDRLLNRTIHEENVFYGRLNFFLVFESLLLAAFVTITPQHAAWPLLRIAMPLLGLIISILWWVAQARQRHQVHMFGKRVNDELPEYTAGQYGGQPHVFSMSWMMAHVVPPVFLVLWLLLLGWTTFCSAGNSPAATVPPQPPVSSANTNKR